MVIRLLSALLNGIDAHPCEVEVDLDPRGIARETVVGLPDAGVRESLERVKSAMGNAGYAAPLGRLLINLAPADVRKEGPVYDLPIAVGLLAAQGIIPSDGPGAMSLPVRLARTLIVGELALDGRVRPVRGVLAMAFMARDQGMTAVIVPHANIDEAAVVPGIDVYGVGTLVEAVGLLTGSLEMDPAPEPDIAGAIARSPASVDFGDVRGQESAKRAMTIAAAGAHNVLMLGPPGTGKTMMAKAIPGILPALTPEEALEITRVYSAAGLEPPGASGLRLATERPVRSPHHTASSAAIVGGGIMPRPGEISLAHRGVLFLDELPEFPRPVLETLRQPLEDHVVTIARAAATVRFPARFMLIAAMNPTPKGDAPKGMAGQREVDKYLARLSRPLVDRIDLHVEVPAVPWEKLRSGSGGTSTADMRSQVESARAIQRSRQGEPTNAALGPRALDRFAPLTDQAEALLGQAIRELGLSARAYDKIRRVARTIVDLDAGESAGDGPVHIGVDAVAEAVQYRLLDRQRA